MSENPRRKKNQRALSDYWQQQLGTSEWGDATLPAGMPEEAKGWNPGDPMTQAQVDEVLRLLPLGWKGVEGMDLDRYLSDPRAAFTRTESGFEFHPERMQGDFRSVIPDEGGGSIGSLFKGFLTSPGVAMSLAPLGTGIYGQMTGAAGSGLGAFGGENLLGMEDLGGYADLLGFEDLAGYGDGLGAFGGEDSWTSLMNDTSFPGDGGEFLGDGGDFLGADNWMGANDADLAMDLDPSQWTGVTDADLAMEPPTESGGGWLDDILKGGPKGIPGVLSKVVKDIFGREISPDWWPLLARGAAGVGGAVTNTALGNDLLGYGNEMIGLTAPARERFNTLSTNPASFLDAYGPVIDETDRRLRRAWSPQVGNPELSPESILGRREHMSKQIWDALSGEKQLQANVGFNSPLVGAGYDTLIKGSTLKRGAWPGAIGSFMGSFGQTSNPTQPQSPSSTMNAQNPLMLNHPLLFWNGSN